MSPRAAIACTTIAALVIVGSRAHAQLLPAPKDPDFGPSGPGSTDVLETRPPMDPPGRPLREHVGQREELLNPRSLDPTQYLPHRPLRPDDATKKLKSIDHDAMIVVGLHLRRVGTTEQLLGALTPSDTLISTFPGLIVVGRLGVEWRRAAVFGIAGAGGARTIHWNVPLHEEAMQALGPVPAELRWSGAIVGGLGVELRVSSSLTFGAECDVSQLTARATSGELLWPNTADAVKTFVGAVRVEY